jgi:hypothetical protein
VHVFGGEKKWKINFASDMTIRVAAAGWSDILPVAARDHMATRNERNVKTRLELKSCMMVPVAALHIAQD